MNKYTKYEQETIFIHNQEERTAVIYTYNQTLIRKLENGCNLFPNDFKLKCESSGARTYIIPKKCISIRIPSKKSPEQLERLRDHMHNIQSMAKTTRKH